MVIVKSLERLEIEVKSLKEDRQPHISKTYSEMGHNVWCTLCNEKLLTKFHGEEGLPSIMTDEDVGAMASLSDEYESNCYAQCKLISVFEEVGLAVVNSERPGFEWLTTLSGVEKCDKRPDLIICNPCFYEARDQPNAGDGVLAVQRKLLENGKTLLYGIKAGDPLRFLDDIYIEEGRKEKLKDADVGQVKTYAGLQARLVTNPAFHRIALFDREKFVLFLSNLSQRLSAAGTRLAVSDLCSDSLMCRVRW